MVADSLFKRATGYSVTDTHVSNYHGDITLTEIDKNYPPETTAAIFWLKNRQKKKWRDKQDHEIGGPDGGPIQTEDINATELLRSRINGIAARLRAGSDNKGNDG